MDELSLAGARVLSGLLAGLYLGFSVAVMPALHRLGDDTFTSAMNAINEVIVSPAFLVVFLGAPALTGMLLIWNRSPLTVLAVGLAGLAVAVTVGANVPLNDALAGGGTRVAFEKPWLLWHALRTAAAITSFALLCRGAGTPTE